MTKADLVEKVADRFNLTKRDTEVIIDTISDAIAQALARPSDAKVELRRFGSFRVRQHRARLGRNPQSARRWRCRPSVSPTSSRARS